MVTRVTLSTRLSRLIPIIRSKLCFFWVLANSCAFWAPATAASALHMHQRVVAGAASAAAPGDIKHICHVYILMALALNRSASSQPLRGTQASTERGMQGRGGVFKDHTPACGQLSQVGLLVLLASADCSAGTRACMHTLVMCRLALDAHTT